MRLISVIDNVIFLGFIIIEQSTFWHRTVFSNLCQHFLEPSLVLVHVHIWYCSYICSIWYCAYICSYIVLCRYVLYGIVLVLDDFILCNCLQFGFMFVNSQLIQYGCTYMALYFVVLRHCIALGPVLPGTPGDWPTSHKRMYCFAVKPWSFIWLCISHTQSYWNAVLVFNVHLIYGQESGYQASSFENLTSLYDPTVPHSSTQFHTVPHRPVMRTSAKDRNFYRGFVAGSYNLVHTNCIHVFTHCIYTQRCAICSLLLVNQ